MGYAPEKRTKHLDQHAHGWPFERREGSHGWKQLFLRSLVLSAKKKNVFCGSITRKEVRFQEENLGEAREKIGRTARREEIVMMLLSTMNVRLKHSGLLHHSIVSYVNERTITTVTRTCMYLLYITMR